METNLGTEEAGIYQSSMASNYSKTFNLSWCCSNFQQIFFKLQYISNKFPNNFATSALKIFHNKSHILSLQTKEIIFFFKFFPAHL